MSEVTRMLAAIDRGEPQAAEELLPLVYDELRQLAAQKLSRENPGAGLVLGGDGNFRGTTAYGGNLSLPGSWGGIGGVGTVFTLTPSGGLTKLVQFNGATDGINPLGGLALDSAGNLYGTTTGGGPGGAGTVYLVSPAKALTTLAVFNRANGNGPNGLVLGADGNFYGTTRYGGPSGAGTVFQVTTNGVLTTLVAFGGQD